MTSVLTEKRRDQVVLEILQMFDVAESARRLVVETMNQEHETGSLVLTAAATGSRVLLFVVEVPEETDLRQCPGARLVVVAVTCRTDSPRRRRVVGH